MTGTRETLAVVRARRDQAADTWIVGGHIDSRDAVALIRDSNRILTALETLVDVCLEPSLDPWKTVDARRVLQIIDDALAGAPRPEPSAAIAVQRRLLDEAAALRAEDEAEGSL